jgi:hypothetical protein
MGVQLTPAEKMRAQTGPWQELAKLFVDDFPVIYSLMKDKSRAKDFQLTLACFSQIVEVLHPSAPNGLPILKTSYAALPKFLSNKGAVEDTIKSRLASIWNTLKDLIEQDPDTFTNADKHLRGVQTFAPIEMVAVTVLISMYSETRNNQLLLRDITALREALREHFTDIRMNVPTWKFIWEFIDDLEAIRGAVDGSTVDRKILKQASRPTASGAMPTVQKGSKTTEVKSAPVVPPRKKVTVKSEKDVPTPKRQRTDAGPSTQPSVTTLPNANIVSTHATNGQAKSPEHKPWRQPPAPAQIPPPPSAYQPPYDSTPMSSVPSNTVTMPQRTSTPGRLASEYHPTHTANVPSMAAQVAGGARAAGLLRQNQPPHPTRSSSLGRRLSTYTPHAPAMTPLPASSNSPAQIQQTPIPELNGYRAPTASMQPSTQPYPPSWLTPTSTPGGSHSSAMPSRPTSNGNALLRPGFGAFTPTYTDEEWNGIVRSISPEMESRATPPNLPTAPTATSQATSSTTPVLAPRTNSKKRKSVTRPTPAQCDGAIDLTSDGELEEERQNLLSSFKASAALKRQSQASSAAPHSPRVPTAPMQRFPLVVQDLEEDVPERANNPYARYRENQGDRPTVPSF